MESECTHNEKAEDCCCSKCFLSLFPPNMDTLVSKKREREKYKKERKKYVQDVAMMEKSRRKLIKKRHKLERMVVQNKERRDILKKCIG